MFSDASPKIGDSDNNLLFKIAQILDSGGSGVSSFNARTGAVTLTLGDVSAVADSRYVLKDADGTALIGGSTAPASLTSGAVMFDGVAASADPVTAAAIWSTTGELQYRTSGANEGAGNTHRVHNRGESIAGAGTNYTLTTSFADVVFGTTSPVLTLPSAGTYFVMGTVTYFADAAGSTDIIQIRIWNSTDSLVIGVSPAFNQGSGGWNSASVAGIATVTGSKTVRLRAANNNAARGELFAANTNISYIRLF